LLEISVKSENKDSMATVAMIVTGLMLLATVVFLVTRLVNVVNENSVKGDVNNETRVEANIQPVGIVATGAVAAGPVVRNGKDIVDAVCISCHGSGVLGAPKIGEKDQWSARVAARGLDGLLMSATNGLNAMPPKGGDPTLTEEELTSAISYMLEKSDIDVKKK
jgi:cytochrome c5